MVWRVEWIGDVEMGGESLHHHNYRHSSALFRSFVVFCADYRSFGRSVSHLDFFSLENFSLTGTSMIGVFLKTMQPYHNSLS
jgi:hypothetical protein